MLGNRSSPFLQEKLALLGCCEVFRGVPKLVESLLGIRVSESQTYRVCCAASEALSEETLNSPSSALSDLIEDSQEQMYGMIDGSMLFTDDGWQESKVGRVFKATPKPVAEKAKPSWKMIHSEYVAKRGHYAAFTEEFERLLPPTSACEKVFITDGALWIGQWLSKQYPKATQILDYFHVCEKLAEVAPYADTKQWFDQMKQYLLDGKQLEVRQSVVDLKRLPENEKEKILTYLDNNARRMCYDQYRKKGLMIGSGPIESAHRTLLQTRMKRSGQRWSDQGCDKMVKLRVAFLSNKFELITNIFRKCAA